MIINLGDAPFKAFITVTYPNGTCTVSLGDKSFSHSGGGTHTFTVNKKGTWTVTCTSNDGYNNKATGTANISYRGQVASVTLSYTMVLYENGNSFTAITGGYSLVYPATTPLGSSTNSNGNLYVQANDGVTNWGSMLTINAINISAFSKLNFIGRYSSTYPDDIGSGGLSTGRQPALTRAVNFPNGTAGTVSLDISDLTGSYYIGIKSGSRKAYVWASKIWLS